jgi:hypothetical protein
MDLDHSKRESSLYFQFYLIKLVCKKKLNERIIQHQKKEDPITDIKQALK